MFNLKKYLRYLWRQGMEIWLEDGQLHFSSSDASQDKARLKVIEDNRDDIVKLLKEQGDIFKGFALSEGQRSIKLMQDMVPHSNAYHQLAALELSANTDLDCLKQSIDQLARRHDCLRVNIVELEGELAQRVNADPLPMLSITQVESYDQEAIETWIDQQADAPFDLHKDALFRFSLLDNSNATTGNPRWVLVAVAHHIIADYWTLEMVLKELVAIYTLAQENQPAPLPQLTATYKDFVLAESRMLSSDKGKAHWEYFHSIINSPPPPLQLPTDFPRPAQQQFHGQEREFVIEAPLAAALREQAKSLGITPYVFMLSAYQVLLHRNSGENTIVVGTPMACRGQPGARHVAGLYTNPIPMLARFDDNPTFAELTKLTRQQVKSGMAHQEFPFQQIVDRLQPDRDLSRTPIFQTAMVWNQLSSAIPEVGGDNWVQSIMRMGQRGAIYDLVMTCFDTGAEIRTGIRFNSDLFRAETMHTLFRHLIQLLTSLVADPDQKIGELELLTEEEIARFAQWNQTAREYPDQHNVAELFERIVALQPEANAISCEGEQLTYTQLDQRASQLAHRLVESGIKGGEYIAVCMDRSIELIISILAITKAGAAYMPIDPDYPDDRLVFMLEDAQAPVVITLAAHKSRFESLALAVKSPQVLCIDETDLDSYPAQWHTQSRAQHGKEPGCVLFTSGSTGRPKGVLVTHRGLARLVLNTNYYQLKPAHIVGHVNNVCFDAASWEIWGALLNGACLFIVSKDTLLNPDKFEPLIESGKISSLLWTTALLNLYAGRNPALFKDMDAVMAGGEALDANIIRKILKAGPPRHLINVYGPTESATFLTTYTIKQLDENANSVPIGPAVSNSTVYVLDRYRQQVPVGVVGEIYGGGDGVALGYLQRPELSREKFVDDPFIGISGAKMYATGDLGKFRADGSLEILGRIDDQVKLRGHRIELSEIENALCGIPGVQSGTVMIRDDQGERYIAAYVVPEQPLQDEEDFYRQLRQSLKQQLPTYMLPSAFLAMDKLPLTANGKIDKKALPQPIISSTQEYVAPTGPLEEKIAAIWQQCLQIDRIGVDDNFFELGGHSLMATQVASRLQEELQCQISMRNLFEAPTIAELSNLIEGHQRRSSLPPIHGGERPSPLPLSLSQQRLWIVDRLDPGNAAYNMPAALRFYGAMDEQALNRALQTIIERHESLRTCFIDNHGQAIQLIQPSVDWELQVSDLSHSSKDEVDAEIRKRALQLATLSFDLASSPLFRVELLRISKEQHVLLFCMHHIISDGWSIEVLLAELGELWQAYDKGQPDPLADLPIQYADFSVWQRQALQGDMLEQQLDYWRQELAGAPALLQLPTDHPRPPRQSLDGAVHRFEIPKAIVDQLKTLSQHKNASLFMTLMAAYSVLLNRYSQQDDICIGFPISGRNLPEFEALIGLFVNNLVIRTDLSDNPTFAQLVEKVRASTLAAYDHQDVPFDHIIEALKLERSLSYTPFLQVSFSLQNQTMEQHIEQMLGRKAELLDIGWISAKYDLHMICYDGSDAMLVELEYCRDLFAADTIKRMSQQFISLLEALLAHPQQGVNNLDLTTAQERELLLSTSGDAWNATGVDYAPPATLHQLFEQQVEKTPDAIALTFEQQSWTYRKLNEHSNRLAHYLQGKGIGPDVIVGVCMERSVHMSLALLAVLKAGGAYAPFDPDFPQERLAFMAEDTAISILLTQQHLTERVPCSAEIIAIDNSATAALWLNQPEHNPPCGIVTEDLFNVIYTSGSTGKPKGVMVPHQGIINRLLWMQASYPISSDDTVLQKTPYSFDVSVWELFWPLTVGARLVYAKPEGHKDADYLVRLIQEEKITTLHFVPSMLGIFLQAQNVENCSSITRIFCSGEALQLEHERRFFQRLPEAELHNLYGPTEASVDVSCFACQKDSQYRSVPIGKPVANTQLHILDNKLQVVPVGMVGELYIGGIQLARGYLNREELTRNTFIDNPFFSSGHPSPRLYKTGDLARYKADGNIEYMGRADFQVKVRGLRIELGEIENVLHQHTDVKETLVITSEVSPGNVLIIAYVVAQAEQPAIETLRQHLAKQLPEYMLPNAFIFLEQMPLSANGKINRRLLPLPDPDTMGRAPYEAPRSETEQVLVEIWQDILNLQQIGIHDNFFEIGGHSLVATQVISRINDHFDADLPLRLIFESPTIAELSLNLLESELGDMDEGDMEAMLAQLLDEELDNG